MKRIYITLILLFPSANLIAQLSDEEDLAFSYGDEEFISIATGSQQPISKAPAVATVITAKDIEEMGAANLDQVLESVPGLHVSVSSARFTPTYQMRGIATNFNAQVLVLINGIPLTQVFQGDRGINSTLPIRSIERVEVIRGPGSAVYGADAFAGVINVTTKSPKDIDGTRVGISTGSFDTNTAWLLHSGTMGTMDYSVSIEAAKTDGDDDRVITFDSQSFFDSLGLGAPVSGAPGSTNTRQERLDLRFDLTNEHWNFRFWNWQQNDIGTGPGIGLALDAKGRSDVDNYLLDATYHNADFKENWDLTVKTSYMDLGFETNYIIFPEGAVLPIGSDGNVGTAGGGLVTFTDGFIGAPAVYEEHWRFDVSTIYSGYENHKLRLAAGVNYVELKPGESKNFGPGVINGTEGTVDGDLTNVTNTPFIFIETEDRKVYYASVQDEWSYATDWTLTAGIRFDDYSDFGSTVNPRVALVWNTSHALTSKLLYGRAFRAPAFAELFAINNPVVLGNRELDPEIINTVELAFDYRPNFDTTLGVNLFAYEIKDLILFVPDSSGASSTAQNTGNQDGKGFEIELKWDVTDNFTSNIQYAYQDSTDKTTNSDAGNSPEQQIYIRATWKFKRNWLFSSQINRVSDRKRILNDPRDEVKDYTTTDISLQKLNPSQSWRLALNIKNIFDEKIFEPSPANLDFPAGSAIPNDFPLEGRNISIEGEYRF